MSIFFRYGEVQTTHKSNGGLIQRIINGFEVTAFYCSWLAPVCLSRPQTKPHVNKTDTATFHALSMLIVKNSDHRFHLLAWYDVRWTASKSTSTIAAQIAPTPGSLTDVWPVVSNQICECTATAYSSWYVSISGWSSDPVTDESQRPHQVNPPWAISMGIAYST